MSVGFSLVWTVVYALRQKTLLSFLPIMTVLYAILANISLSLFTELEFTLWMLLIIASVISIGVANKGDSVEGV